MRRKYDKRNKRNFLIVLVISIAIICIFFLFIYKYNKVNKILYNVSSGAIIQDTNRNYLKLDDDANLKLRWNGKYYLEYMDNKIDLSKKVIIFNSLSNSMKLYGDFLEIDSQGKVIELHDETVIDNMTKSRFFKIDDREYLIIGKNILSSDRSIQTSNYLLVELDKLGNAKLSNDNLNLKTIVPTELVTTDYSFDIAREILKYGKLEIDLKKIIGSTNKYEDKDDDKDNNQDSDNNTLNGSTNTGNVSNTDNSNGIGTGDGGDGIVSGNDFINGDSISLEELIKKLKMTSIIRVTEGVSSCGIDYVIYDPYNEYKDVYAEVIRNGVLEKISLNKNENYLVIDGLMPSNKYHINFIYEYIDKDSLELVPYTFEEIDINTKDLEFDISMIKLSKVYNTITYKVSLLDNFSIDSLKVNLSFDYKEVDELGNTIVKHASLDDTLNVSGNVGSINGVFNIEDYNIDEDTVIKLTIVSVSRGSLVYPVNITKPYGFGRK